MEPSGEPEPRAWKLRVARVSRLTHLRVADGLCWPQKMEADMHAFLARMAMVVMMAVAVLAALTVAAAAMVAC